MPCIPPVEIHCGDAAAVLASLPAGSVNCCVTSPPYYGLRDYGHAGQIGLEESPAAYVAKLVDVFRQVRRVLADDGTVWLNLGDSYAGSWGNQGRKAERGTQRPINGDMLTPVHDGRYPDKGSNTGKVPDGWKPKDLLGIPWRVAFALQDDGWYLRQDIIWAKPNPMPESVRDRCTKAHEYLFLLSKRERYWYDAEAIKEPARPDLIGKRNGHWGNPDKGQRATADGRKATGNEGACARIIGRPFRNRRSVWTVSPRPYKGAHFAVMPAELVRPCVRAGTSERGHCPKCRAGWVRVVERETIRRERPNAHAKYTDRGQVGQPDQTKAGVSVTTTGWAPSCKCHAGDPVPGVVLDPFGGSGTVGQVAIEEGRRAVLVELNPDYVPLIRSRLAAAKPPAPELYA